MMFDKGNEVLTRVENMINEGWVDLGAHDEKEIELLRKMFEVYIEQTYIKCGRSIRIIIPANVGDNIYLVKYIDGKNYIYELLVSSIVITDDLRIKACDIDCGGYTFKWDHFDKIVFVKIEDAIIKVKNDRQHGKLLIRTFGNYNREIEF